MVFQIELRGGPLDGQSHLLEDGYPEHVLIDLEPEPPTEATEHAADVVPPRRRAAYRKRPREPRKLAVYYDFDGIH